MPDATSHLGLKIRKSAKGTPGCFDFAENTKNGRINVILGDTSNADELFHRIFVRNIAGLLSFSGPLK